MASTASVLSRRQQSTADLPTPDRKRCQRGANHAFLRSVAHVPALSRLSRAKCGALKLNESAQIPVLT